MVRSSERDPVLRLLLTQEKPYSLSPLNGSPDIILMSFLRFLKKLFTRKPEGKQEEYSMVNFPTTSNSLQPQPQPLKHDERTFAPSHPESFVTPQDTDTIIPGQFLTLPSNPPPDQIPYQGELGPEDFESSPKYAPELRRQVDDAIIGTNPEDSVASIPLPPPYTKFNRQAQSADGRVYYADPRTGIIRQTNYNVPGHSYYAVAQLSTNRDASHMHHLRYGPPRGPRSPHRREQPAIQVRSSEIPRRPRNTSAPADSHHPLRT
ncbi:hypothetical protein Clacol_007702 [Clathrus columnatus]|uniref:Uncharacterized protein n=1 Tax=Clathrus columnatus TaxID=1419009 RepID=A0AAV5AK21_9AGAM|nr:hypothetical protein Clacol_007702 [Clathrus columnatus]